MSKTKTATIAAILITLALTSGAYAIVHGALKMLYVTISCLGLGALTCHYYDRKYGEFRDA